MPQQIARHLIGQFESTCLRVLTQGFCLLCIGQCMYLVHQAPTQTGAQIIAQLQEGWSLLAAD